MSDKQYDQQSICDLLNTLKRFENFEYDGLIASELGDYVELKDVAALFNLMADTYKADLPVRKKILPNG